MIIKIAIKCLPGLFIMLAGDVNAQSYHNLLSVGYSLGMPGTRSERGDVSLCYVKASLPLKLKSGDYLLLNPDLHRQVFSFQAGAAECYKTGITTAYMKMKKKGNIIAVFNLSNNFEKGRMGFNSLQTGAGFLATRKLNSRLKLKLGLYANREFFGPLIVPLLGVDYKLAPAIRLFGVMPQNMRLEFRHRHRLRTVVLFESPLNTYHTFGNAQNRYIDQRQILMGLTEDIYLGKNLVLQMSFKYPVANSQRLFNSDQTYRANIWGVGIGGERAVNARTVAAIQHGPLIECSLNYRIEVE